MTTLNTSNSSSFSLMDNADRLRQWDAEEEERFLKEKYGENWEELVTECPFLTEMDTPMVKEVCNLLNPALKCIVEAALAHNWEEAHPYTQGMNALACLDKKDWPIIAKTVKLSWYGRLVVEQALSDLYKGIYTNVIHASLSMYHGDLVLRLIDGSEEVFEQPLQD